MSAAAAGTLVPVDPFAFSVPKEKDDLTLFAIADTIAKMPLSDLRQLNPELDALPANVPVPTGTVVRLAAKVVQRAAAPTGPYVSLAEEERRIGQCYETLDALVAEVAAEEKKRREGGSVSSSVTACFPLPSRSVLSKTEQVMRVVRAEAERQLPHVQDEIGKPGRKPHHVKYMLDTTAVKDKVEEVEKKMFTEECVQLECFARANELPFDTLEEPSSLTPATMEPRMHDEESDFCIDHSHRWEFTFKSQTSAQDNEAWAVLSCQKLTVLMDAFECLPSQFSTDTRFQNAFLFIGGVFYVDDRHAGEPGYEDLSAAIRLMDPLSVHQRQVGVGGACEPGHYDVEPNSQDMHATLTQGANLGYGQCPVMSASTTTFGELRVRMGEQGVLRHRGSCDHYLYLSNVCSLQNHTRTKRSAYPHRVMKRRELVLRCCLCEQFPSTVVLHGDECSSTSPAAYCAMCYELLHKDETSEEAARYIKVVARPGEYFKRPY